MSVKTRLALHGGVAAVALLLAFTAWRSEREEALNPTSEEDEGVVIAELSRDDLKGISYRSEDRSVEITLSKSPPYTVEVTTKVKLTRERPRRRPEPSSPAGVDGGPGSADGGVLDGDGGASAVASLDGGPPAGDGGAPDEAEPEYRDQRLRFAGNKNLDDLIEGLTPLRALRRLGELSEGQLREFELVEPEATIELKLRGGVRRLSVGARTFGSGSHYYVLDSETGEGLLFNSKIVRDLEMAQTRLMQREMHRFEMNEVSKAVISFGGRRREVTHEDRESLRDSRWVEGGEGVEGGEERSKTLTNWMRQLVRLRALSYPTEGDDFSGDGAAPVFRIDYKDEEGASMGFVEVVGDEGPPEEYFGRSEATGSWVRLSKTVVEQLRADLGDVLGEGP